ncbi:unnamed protein product [Schistosoma mattheei]|nr:unnamed protein product [Schistosoma mattheei]
MPTPDFSMPFNVLCLVCSVVAVVFGSVHKATTTVFNVTLQQNASDSIITHLINRILTKKNTSKTMSEQNISTSAPSNHDKND